jgi:hypothetical protein
MFKEIITYLRKPVYRTPDQTASLKTKLVFLAYSYLICLGAIAVISLVTELADYIIVHWFHENSVMDTIHKTNSNMKITFGKLTFLMVVIVAPFLEELIFRLPLNLRKMAFAIAVFILVYRFSGNHIYGVNLADSKFYSNSAIALVAALLVYGFLPDKLLQTLKGKNFRYFFYLSALIFGLVHISNFYVPGFSAFVFYPLFVLPQMIMGLLIGGTRMRYGFLYGFLLHALINLPSVLLN